MEKEELRVMHPETEGKFSFSPEGIEVKINLSILIESVYVAPFSFSWLPDVVSNILEKYGLGGIDVKKSAYSF